LRPWADDLSHRRRVAEAAAPAARLLEEVGLREKAETFLSCRDSRSRKDIPRESGTPAEELANGSFLVPGQSPDGPERMEMLAGPLVSAVGTVAGDGSVSDWSNVVHRAGPSALKLEETPAAGRPQTHHGIVGPINVHVPLDGVLDHDLDAGSTAATWAHG
jgi:hypothetical protein